MRLTLDTVESAIAFDQPKLTVIQENKKFIVRGTYLLFEASFVVHPDGPMTEFSIKIELPNNYPKSLPRVFETGNRIPRIADRHVNPKGDCCVTVWEHWLACTTDKSFQAYLNGPLREFFLGQYLYEEKGRWPFGERSHGYSGLVEAYADVLGIENDHELLRYYLRLLSHDWPKGHWLCPCASGRILRRCHKERLALLHEKIPPQLANQMLRQVKKHPSRKQLNWKLLP